MTVSGSTLGLSPRARGAWDCWGSVIASRLWAEGSRSARDPVKGRCSSSASRFHRGTDVGTRVMLVDDHAIVRQGLTALLEREGFGVVGQAADGMQAIQLAKELRPEVVILDFGMPILNGLDAARAIHEALPTTRLVLLTMHTDEQYVLEGLRAGIRGFVLKTQAAADLVRAIRDVQAGTVFLGPGMSKAIVDAYLSGSAAPADHLTPRERQVLQLVAE